MSTDDDIEQAILLALKDYRERYPAETTGPSSLGLSWMLGGTAPFSRVMQRTLRRMKKKGLVQCHDRTNWSLKETPDE